MKKFSVILIVSFLIALLNNNCEKNESTEPPDPQPKQVREFLNSADFCGYESLFSKYGKISIGRVEYLNPEEDSTYQLLIPIKSNDSLTAYIQVIKVPEGELPNGEVYFMNLMNLKKVDEHTMTGNVRMFGLNYDGFEHSNVSIKDNIIVSCESFPLPDKFKIQMGEKGFLRDFLSCYRQMRAWQNSIDALYFICDWAMVSCAAAATAGCIIHMCQ